MTTSNSITTAGGPARRPAARPADPCAAATKLHDELSDQADDAERLRDLPDNTVRLLREAGLYSLALPARLGGLEAPVRTIIATIETLTHADPAVGWSVLIGQGSAFLAWLDPEIADEIVAVTPEPIVASSFAPVAATPSGLGSYRLSGRWPYCSGITHAEWIMGAFLAPQPGGPPQMRYGFLTTCDLAVAPTWDPAGLSGTGSNHIQVADVLVDEAYTTDPRTVPAREPGQLYRLPMFSLLMVCMAGFPLGVARRALDEFHTTATVKSRSSSRRPLAEDPYVQADILHAEAAWQAARAGVHAAADELWAAAATTTPSPAVRARFAASVQHAMRTALDVTDTCFQRTGGGALYRKGFAQRCWRDTQVAASHVVFGAESVRRLGAALLGLDVPSALL